MGQEILKAVSKDRKRTFDLEALKNEGESIIIAYQWLDAQTKMSVPLLLSRDFKHIIERWAGVYIPKSSVEVAALMHPRVRGSYPHFNISRKLVRPSRQRLLGISTGGIQREFLEVAAQSYSSEESWLPPS